MSNVSGVVALTTTTSSGELLSESPIDSNPAVCTRPGISVAVMTSRPSVRLVLRLDPSVNFTVEYCTNVDPDCTDVDIGVSSGDALPDVCSQIENPYFYTGRRMDEETGQYYFRARYYDAEQGRFISRDSYGYVNGKGLYNGYFAAGFNTDPSGHAVHVLVAAAAGGALNATIAYYTGQNPYHAFIGGAAGGAAMALGLGPMAAGMVEGFFTELAAQVSKGCYSWKDLRNTTLLYGLMGKLAGPLMKLMKGGAKLGYGAVKGVGKVTIAAGKGVAKGATVVAKAAASQGKKVLKKVAHHLDLSNSAVKWYRKGKWLNPLNYDWGIYFRLGEAF